MSTNFCLPVLLPYLVQKSRSHTTCIEYQTQQVTVTVSTRWTGMVT